MTRMITKNMTATMIVTMMKMAHGNDDGNENEDDGSDHDDDDVMTMMKIVNEGSCWREHHADGKKCR